MIDFTPYFNRYESLVFLADETFNKIAQQYPDCVKCTIQCSDCCHALFDLTLIEAIYINHQFNRKFEGTEKAQLIEKANTTDRKIYKIKRKAYKRLEAGKSEDRILEELSGQRIRCPLLNNEETCDLYAYRPITCRLYGIPTSVGDRGHTCGQSGFVKGKNYPSVKMDVLHQKLYEISLDLVRDIQSQYARLAEILVPLSMAMLTDYDEQYLGTGDAKDADNRPEQEG